DRMHELEIHAPLPAVDPPDRRQHDEEKGADRGAVMVPALSHLRSGPGVGTSRMAMTAKSRISTPIYFEPAASPTRRPSRTARCGAGSCSNLISAASASTRNAATKISSLNRRACTTKSGATVVAAAAARA